MEKTEKKKGGRPPKESREKKSYKIELKLTQQDFEKLDQQYQNAGYRNRSDMYYDMLFHQTLRQKDSGTLLLLKEVQELTREVKAIGAAYHEVVAQVTSRPDAVADDLHQLIQLTEQWQAREKEMFGLIVKLRDKWLREL